MGGRSDLKQKAYRVIKDKIVRCELMPGQDISEAEIAEEIGISRTPVREAIMRLEHEKLLKIYPRKGIVVSSLSLGVINDIFQLRKIIEPQVLKLAAGKLDDTELLRLKESFADATLKRAAYEEFVELDMEFHSYLIRANNNKYMMQLMENIYDQNQRIRALSSRNMQRLSVSNDEHVDIIDLLLEKDIDKAEKRLRVHLENAHRSALDIGD